MPQLGVSTDADCLPKLGQSASARKVTESVKTEESA